MLLVLGSGIMLAGLLLVFARRSVIRRVTSRSLGSLAPGYAATQVGYCLYALLVIDIGFIVLSLGAGASLALLAGVVVFVLASIAVMAGEVVTYRALKR